MQQTELINHFGNPLKNQSSFENKWMELWVVPFEIHSVINLPIKIYSNKIIKEPLIKSFRDLISEGISDELHKWDGCFEPRLQRGSTRISLHAFGLAIDINASSNKQGTNGNQSKLFISCFERNGFYWGGRFSGLRIDPMHFQIQEF